VDDKKSAQGVDDKKKDDGATELESRMPRSGTSRQKAAATIVRRMVVVGLKKSSIDTTT
jgi:hypothetical protein